MDKNLQKQIDKLSDEILDLTCQQIGAPVKQWFDLHLQIMDKQKTRHELEQSKKTGRCV